MTHTEDNCPIYHREKLPEVIEAFDNLEALGKELNVKPHFFVACGPDLITLPLPCSKPTASLRYPATFSQFLCSRTPR